MVTRRSLFGLLAAVCVAARLKPKPAPSAPPASPPVELPVTRDYTAQLNGGTVRFVRFIKDGFVVESV